MSIDEPSPQAIEAARRHLAHELRNSIGAIRSATEHCGCTAGSFCVTMVSKAPNKFSFPP